MQDMMGSLLAADNRRAGARGGFEWRPAWVFKGNTKDKVRELLKDAPRPILNACSGSTRFGDVNLDWSHPSADIHASAKQAPFPNGAFGTVFMDPPWDGEDLMGRQAFIEESSRLLRTGGKFILYAPWMPGITWARLEEVFIRHQGTHRLPGWPLLITVWTKTSEGKYELDEAQTFAMNLALACPETPAAKDPTAPELDALESMATVRAVRMEWHRLASALDERCERFEMTGSHDVLAKLHAEALVCDAHLKATMKLCARLGVIFKPEQDVDAMAAVYRANGILSRHGHGFIE